MPKSTSTRCDGCATWTSLAARVWLAVRVRQFFCPECERYFTERLAFADSGKSFTHRQANGGARRWIFDCCAKQPFTQVGALLGLNAKTVERIYYQQVQAQLGLPARYAALRRLGIDEPGRRAIAHHKGKASYCCVLVDRQAALLDRNIYLDVLPIRSKTTLTAHFERLGPPFCAQIESDSFDMWPAYGRVCHHFFPQAVRVVDRFHLVKAPLDALRRQQPQMEAFINIRWDLFKAHPTVAQQARLRAAFDHSPLLEALVEMRDDFHARFESARDARQMEEVLQTWISQARALIHRDLAGLICTLRNWLPQIANFAHQRLTNAATEGLNNVIRYVKRISYGLPNFEHLRLRILAQAI